MICVADTTGEYSVYTEYKDSEIMFHVSTLLPHTASNRQQVSWNTVHSYLPRVVLGFVVVVFCFVVVVVFCLLFFVCLFWGVFLGFGF